MKIQEIEIKYSPIQKQDRIKITTSSSAFKAFLSSWNKDTIELQEEFKIMLLNNSNEVLGIHTLSKGGMTACYVDIKLLFAVAIKSGACNIILVHNHPSGNLKPSTPDIGLYKKIKKASEYLDTKVLDNLIITKTGYYSFADDGLI